MKFNGILNGANRIPRLQMVKGRPLAHAQKARIRVSIVSQQLILATAICEPNCRQVSVTICDGRKPVWACSGELSLCSAAQESCHSAWLLAPDDSKIVAATRIKVFSSYPQRTADQSSG